MQGSINFDGSLIGNITGGGGSGGSEVVITPVLTSGTKIADVTVDGEDKDLYAPTPTPPTPATEVSVTQTLSSGTKIATINVNEIDYDIYSTDYSGDISTLQSGLSTANSNITALQGRVTTAEGNITTLQSDMTATESIIGDGQLDIGNDLTDAVNEINQSLSDLTPLEKTASGAIVTFDDGSDLPMPSLKVSIEPVQSGSGDPSPTNIRPISGHTKVNVTVCGKNLFVEDFDEYTLPDNYSICPVRLKMGSTYTITAVKTGNTVSGCLLGIVKDGDRYSNFIGRQNIIDSTGTVYSPITITIDSSYTNPKIVFYGTAASFAQILANYEIMFSEGSAAAYVPYNGHTYTIDLGGTRYGGELDVVSGLLTITDGYIASYNGETLPSTWISDRDIYAEGTTPTVGAEVVYKLANPQTDQLTPTQVNSLLGVNNIWANTGELELTYFVNNSLVYCIYDMINILTS